MDACILRSYGRDIMDIIKGMAGMLAIAPEYTTADNCVN